ncbi:MAG: hypothetical protein K2J93_00735 [Anaeroplasmataceae bacterium]|nr:hypothetical protein [Anaeroplasmataceae bacterium]
MKNKIIDWIPGIISELVAAVFCLIYSLIDGEKITMYLQILGAALLPFLFPIYTLISKKRLPVLLPILCGIFVFLASNLGTAMHFYDKIYCWDLIMHGIFGFICSLIVFIFLLRWNGNKLNPVGFLIIIFVFTMGIAAIWEVFEYISSCITGEDVQRVLESISMGKSPLADTMEDIMIAMAGSTVFYITLFIDKVLHYKVYSKLCGFDGFKYKALEK